MGSVLALLFIGATAAAGIYVGTRPTVARGAYFAATLEAANKKPRGTIRCDDAVPIGIHGAVFRCEVGGGGARERYEVTLDRGGQFSTKLLEADVDGALPEEGDEPDRDDRRGGAGGDPWN